ncbi:hypothetical protein ALC62_08762 [Cyphomyrmex costatus]|uniref:Uncharacterized protein n=1 Tax=Cyphomyrmex costatus TaxID=456900 RepID=A0A195CIB1_9HYME|nr:hypothetical protein ALC62_08762 [Cyphomyrmex costatus]
MRLYEFGIKRSHSRRDENEDKAEITDKSRAAYMLLGKKSILRYINKVNTSDIKIITQKLLHKNINYFASEEKYKQLYKGFLGSDVNDLEGINKDGKEKLQWIIYLTIQATLEFEQCVHFCAINKIYVTSFEQIFKRLHKIGYWPSVKLAEILPCTNSNRIFIKILFQEFSKQEVFKGLFLRDDPKNTQNSSPSSLEGGIPAKKKKKKVLHKRKENKSKN